MARRKKETIENVVKDLKVEIPQEVINEVVDEIAKDAQDASGYVEKESEPKTTIEEAVKKEEPVKDGEVLGGKKEKQVEPKAGTDGDTVVVLLNYPRDVKFMVPDGRGRMHPIIINGNAGNLKGKEKGVIPVGAFGVTTGVPADAWKWIQKHHCDNPLLLKGLMFSTDANKARKAAEERQELRHGYEPVDPEKGKSRPYKG